MILGSRIIKTVLKKKKKKNCTQNSAEVCSKKMVRGWWGNNVKNTNTDNCKILTSSC